MRYREIVSETRRLKHGSTRGHIGEFILGSAVTAKFLAGKNAITTEEIKDVMKRTAENKSLTSEFEAERQETTDEIVFSNVVKNPKNIKDIRDVESTFEAMQKEIKSALSFANSDQYAKKLSRIFAENGKPDRIIVKASGEEAQRETKADIFLSYIGEDGKERVLRPISLKTGSSLIGQASPRTFENMKVFFSDLGINLPDMPNYEENVEENVKQILKTSANQLNRMTAGNDTGKESELVKNLYNFLSEHASLNDPKLVIVNLEAGDYSAQKINKLLSNLDQVDLETTFVESGRRPAVVVHNKGNIKEFLFRVRYTFSPSRINSKGKPVTARHTMIVEVGPLFKSLSSLKKSDDL